MKLEPVLNLFKTQREMAEALDIDEAQISRWKKGNGIVPIKHAIKVMNMTTGQIDLCVEDYK